MAPSAPLTRHLPLAWQNLIDRQENEFLILPSNRTVPSFARSPPPVNVFNTSRLMFVCAHAVARATYTHTQTTHTAAHSHCTQLWFLLA